MQDDDLSEQQSNGAPFNDKDNEENKLRVYGQLSQSRSAILTAVIILFIVDALGIIFTFLGDDLETRVFPTTFHLVFSVLIDLFLAINILRGKRWARTWMLIRLVLGVVVWGIVYAVQGDPVSLIINTGVLIALIILLTGTSTRFRQVSGVAIAVVALIGGVILSFFVYSTDMPTVPETITIPASFSTYTSEGFFSISYPSDWAPQMSIVAKAEEESKQYLKDIGMGSLVDEYQLVFVGGIFPGDDNSAFVTVSVEPKSAWPLEAMVESTHQWSIENVERYIEHSRIKTKIDGKTAVIQTLSGNDVDSNFIGFINAFVAGDKFLWTVQCICDSEKLDSNLDTFDQVVRSLRVEY